MLPSPIPSLRKTCVRQLHAHRLRRERHTPQPIYHAHTPHLQCYTLFTGRAPSLRGYHRAGRAHSTGSFIVFDCCVLVASGTDRDAERSAARLDHGPHVAGLAVAPVVLLADVGTGGAQHAPRRLAKPAHSLVVVMGSLVLARTLPSILFRFVAYFHHVLDAKADRDNLYHRWS